MSVVIVLSDCPPKLRGDMTKWLMEINTGVYVGNVSARIREELWERITQNIGHGHATMVYSAQGEQHMDFRVHNGYWEPVDFDGIKLMRRPAPQTDAPPAEPLKKGFSKAAHRRMGTQHKPKQNAERFCVSDYVVLDLETTGLDERADEIIEIAALLVENGVVSETMQTLVNTDEPLPDVVTRLTGLTPSELRGSGIPLPDALEKLTEFAEDLPFVCHNAAFDRAFLTQAFCRQKEDAPENRWIDTLAMAKLLLPEIGQYALSSIAEYLEIPCDEKHRALADCKTAQAVYEKLKELALPRP